MSYTVLVHEDEEAGGFRATVAELAGCYTQGETLDEVRVNVIDAIECHLEGQPVEKHDPLAATLLVQVVQVSQSDG